MMKKLKKMLLTPLLLIAVTAAALYSAPASAAYVTDKEAAPMPGIPEDAYLESSVMAQLSRGVTVVTLDNGDDNWYRVTSGGTTGYAASKYITNVTAMEDFTAAGIIAGSGAQLRSQPTAAGTILGIYAAGSEVGVIGICIGWYKVTVGRLTGYMRSDLVTLTEVPEQPAAEADAEAAEEPAEEPAVPVGQQIADFARQFAGYKYIYGASSPSVGFDCSGLCYYVYGQFGYSISRTASQQYKNNGTAVSKEDLQPGDLVFFSSNGGRSVTHVGLYIGDGSFVNASTSRTGVIISSVYSDYYTRVWYGAKRIVS